MTLPTTINPNDAGHISDHEEMHALLDDVVSPFLVANWDVDLFANRPAAGTAGRFFYASDTGELFFDDGSAWRTLKPAGPSAAYVATAETTSSTSYTDLATAGPSVTVVVGDSGRLLVGIACQLGASTLNGTFAQPTMGFALSGANTVSAADSYEIRADISDTTARQHPGAVYLLDGLNRGSTTVTAKYKGRDASDVLRFEDRRIWAQPMI